MSVNSGAKPKAIQTLIIENDPMLAQIFARLTVKVPDFEIRDIVHTYEEGLTAAQKEPQLILLDIFLDGSGAGFLKELRCMQLDVDVIVITADKTIGAVTECMRYGCMDYIIKPFVFARFHQALLDFADIFRDKRKFHERILQQEDVDLLKRGRQKTKGPAMSGGEDGKGPAGNYLDGQWLPKNIHKLTLEKIWACFQEESTYTVYELARISGLSYSSVKKYLNYLNIQGKVEQLLHYSKVGRPLMYYKYKKDM